MIKTQFECDIKSMQTVWGGEYRNVSTFLKTHGIIHVCPVLTYKNKTGQLKDTIES